MLLGGQVAVVTGANRGIGRAIAVGLAREGARVAVTGRSKERCQVVVEEIRRQHGEAQAVALDVTRDDQVEAAIGEVLETWGQIDVLVNNAGIWLSSTPVWQTTIEQWDQIMAVNLRGVFLCCRAVAPHMVERGRGVIINIGSSSGRRAVADDGPYSTSKWGLVGYTVSLARSLRPHGVRVNGVNPGGVDTDAARVDQPQGDPQWSTPEEIAQVVVFLASQTPRDMTSQFIDVFQFT